MGTIRKSRSRAILSATIGLALALVVATGVKLSADDGGFFCGYGDCWFQYWNCDWASHNDTGGGTCTVEVADNPGCYVEMDCDGGAFGWVGLQGFEWELEILLIED